MKSPILILPTLFLICQSAIVVDLAGSFTNYSCLVDSNISQVIIRSYHSYGAIDLQAQKNIYLSNQAGLATDTYMFPCRGKSPQVQVQQLLTYLDSMTSTQSAFAYTTGTIWLDIQTNPSSGCSWTIGTPLTNCQFISTLVTELKAAGRSVGIYASHYMWLKILGDVDQCNIFTDLPLWYAHYDNVRNFDDWQSNKFGGWSKPTLKQFAGDSAICDGKVDLSYY